MFSAIKKIFFKTPCSDDFEEKCARLLGLMFAQHGIEPIPIAVGLADGKFVSLTAFGEFNTAYEQKFKTYRRLISKDFQNSVNAMRKGHDWPKTWIKNAKLKRGPDFKHMEQILTGGKFPLLTPKTPSAHDIMSHLKAQASC